MIGRYLLTVGVATAVTVGVCVSGVSYVYSGMRNRGYF